MQATHVKRRQVGQRPAPVGQVGTVVITQVCPQRGEHAALAVLGATMRPGVEIVLDLVGFSSVVEGAALVVTGEGSLDRQTLLGKTPAGVAAVTSAA